MTRLSLVLSVLLMCEWCKKQFDARQGRCPDCLRRVYTPRA